jgi:hypothetical protein
MKYEIGDYNVSAGDKENKMRRPDSVIEAVDVVDALAKAKAKLGKAAWVKEVKGSV